MSDRKLRRALQDASKYCTASTYTESMVNSIACYNNRDSYRNPVNKRTDANRPESPSRFVTTKLAVGKMQVTVILTTKDPELVWTSTWEADLRGCMRSGSVFSRPSKISRRSSFAHVGRHS